MNGKWKGSFAPQVGAKTKRKLPKTSEDEEETRPQLYNLTKSQVIEDSHWLVYQYDYNDAEYQGFIQNSGCLSN